jgi:hypothetical protein
MYKITAFTIKKDYTSNIRNINVIINTRYYILGIRVPKRIYNIFNRRG